MTGFLLCTTATYGKPEYAKKEKKCAYCHTKMGSKDLNDSGQAVTRPAITRWPSAPPSISRRLKQK